VRCRNRRIANEPEGKFLLLRRIIRIGARAFTIVDRFELSPLRVLQVIPSISAVHGGPSTAIRSMVAAISALGTHVEVATTDDDGPRRRLTRSAGKPIDEGDGMRVHFFPKQTEFYKVSPGFARWIIRHVRDYDLVHIHALFSFTSVVAAWAAQWAGVPYVVRPLGVLNQYGVTQRRPGLKQLSLKLIEGPILRHAAAVHFTAEAERKEAEALGVPMRGVVIPLGIPSPLQQDASVFLARFPHLAGQRILLLLSRLDPIKNLEGLLRAFSLIAGSQPNARLAIAGDGKADYVAGLKRLADALGLADRVVWAGFVDGELKASAFAAAQVVVLPSFSENFGIAAAEALMAGLPCVLGEGVALADDVAQAGAGVVTAPDSQAIARALQELLGDDARLAEMGRQARLLARSQYSMDAMGARLYALYSRILPQNSSGHIE
jgi:glycosyltransferase involved in cell wall biosynthesis